MNENYSKGPKHNYITNETDFYHIDDIWSLDILELKVYGPEIIRGCRNVLAVIDIFSKYGWPIPLKNKNAQRKTNSSENILIKSERSPKLIETDRGKEFYTDFLLIS